MNLLPFVTSTLLLSQLLPSVICSSRSNRPFSCGNELSKPQTDHLNRPSSLDLGVYINIDAPLSCSGNLTGYYYTYLNKNDYVVEGTISMWSSNSHGLEQIINTQHSISQNMRRKRMPKKPSPEQNVEVYLPQPVPVLRGSVVGVHIASSGNKDSGYYILEDQETSGLCYFQSMVNQLSGSCPTRLPNLVLLIQPIVDVIDCGQQPGIVAQDTQYGAIVTLPCKSGKRLTFSCLENGEWRTTSTNCGNLPLPSSTTSKTKTKRTSGSNFAPVTPIAGGPLATESQYHLTAVYTAIPTHSISLAPATASTLSSGIVVLLVFIALVILLIGVAISPVGILVGYRYHRKRKLRLQITQACDDNMIDNYSYNKTSLGVINAKPPDVVDMGEIPYVQLDEHGLRPTSLLSYAYPRTGPITSQQQQQLKGITVHRNIAYQSGDPESNAGDPESNAGDPSVYYGNAYM